MRTQTEAQRSGWPRTLIGFALALAVGAEELSAQVPSGRWEVVHYTYLEIDATKGTLLGQDQVPSREEQYFLLTGREMIFPLFSRERIPYVAASSHSFLFRHGGRQHRATLILEPEDGALLFITLDFPPRSAYWAVTLRRLP